MGSERAAIKPDDQLAPWQIQGKHHYGEHFDLLRRTVQGGARYIAASDAGVSRTFFGEYPLTLEVMVTKLDIAPMDALRATTGNAAVALGVSNAIGALSPGRRGDVLVVDGDPLSDIRAMRSVRAVYRDGTQLVNSGSLV
jgi:imidazolonepropionase-like amidohydrolase